MSSRDSILAQINKNRPPDTPMPEIHLGGKSLPSLSDAFLAALGKISAEAVRIESLEEARKIYELSVQGGRSVLNAVPGLAEIDSAELAARDAPALADVYQAWIPGILGVAENGAIWLEESSIVNRLLPFICEHLVIVISAENLVVNMHDAYSRIRIDKEGYGVFLAGPSKTADIEQSLVVGAHGARSLIVYLIEKK